MTAIERLPNLRDVLEDALLQCENLTSGEAAYVLERIRAHAETPPGRLEVAGMIGHAEHLEVERAFLHVDGAEQPISGGLVVNLEHAAGIGPAEGETVLVIVQRRWEP